MVGWLALLTARLFLLQCSFLPDCEIWGVRTFLEPLRALLSLFHTGEVERQQAFFVFKEESELSSVRQEFVLDLLCRGFLPLSLSLPIWAWSRPFWGQGQSFSSEGDFSSESARASGNWEGQYLWKLPCIAAEHGKGEISMVENPAGGILCSLMMQSEVKVP